MALLEIPHDFEDYLRGSERKVVRTARNRSAARGFTFATSDPTHHLDEIMEVNRSKPVRQDREMEPAYLDRQTVLKDLRDFPEAPCVFDRNGRLMAYALVPECGELANISRILGHAEALDSGVMSLLLSQIVSCLIESRKKTGAPKYLMYDTFYGATPGLKDFKKRFGFRPYKVNWSWDAKA